MNGNMMTVVLVIGIIIRKGKEWNILDSHKVFFLKLYYYDFKLFFSPTALISCGNRGGTRASWLVLSSLWICPPFSSIFKPPGTSCVCCCCCCLHLPFSPHLCITKPPSIREKKYSSNPSSPINVPCPTLFACKHILAHLHVREKYNM